jgi:hypothetical protein
MRQVIRGRTPNDEREAHDMRLGLIITQADAETVVNALRLALFSLEHGDRVRIFLPAKGVEMDRDEDPRFGMAE